MSESEKEKKILKKAIQDSVKEIGYLYPVLEAADGTVIAGKHRLDANPEWKRERIKGIVTPLQKAQVKIAENLIRREIPREEKTEMLDELAKALIDAGFEGNIVKEIAKRSMMSVSWVQEYLPEEYKDMKMVRRPDPEATKIEGLIRIDIHKSMGMTEEERKKAGLQWRQIMKKHKIGSSTYARIKKEIKADIATELEAKSLIKQEPIVVTETVRDEEPETVAAEPKPVEDVLYEPAKKSPVQDASEQEITSLLELKKDLERFFEKWDSITEPTTYGQGIFGTLRQLCNARPFEPYFEVASEKTS